MDNVEPVYWHYTTSPRLRQIRQAGYIRRAFAGVPRGERLAVWFTSRDTWEPTATKAILMPDGSMRPATLTEMQVGCGPLVRLGVGASVVPYSWQFHRRCGRIDPRLADAVEHVSRAQGADPDEWRLSYREIAVAEICAIQTSNDGMSWSEVWADVA